MQLCDAKNPPLNRSCGDATMLADEDVILSTKEMVCPSTTVVKGEPLGY